MVFKLPIAGSSTKTTVLFMVLIIGMLMLLVVQLGLLQAPRFLIMMIILVKAPFLPGMKQALFQR
jgi:hypothetical protein